MVFRKDGGPVRRWMLAALLAAWVGSGWAQIPLLQAAPLRPRPELLISPDWLEKHRGDPQLRIVDVRDREEYVKGHLPGAVHLAPHALFTTVDGVPGLLPPVSRVAGKLGALGVGPDTVVVAYDDANGLYAARLFWALDYIGQGKGRLLDGGWPLWVRQKRTVSRAEPRVTPQTLTARPQAEVLANLDWMREHLGNQETIYVDARSTYEYRGVTKYAKHRGRIPGAVSMEWKRHLKSDGTFRPAEELTATFRELGVTGDKEVAVYCQVHVRAAHSYFTLKWLGFDRVRGYDGSWAEWGNRDDTPKESF